MARILVIDDDDKVREIMIKVLQGAGYEVDGAPEGNTGLSLFRKNSYNLVITDLIMPEKEGLQTIMELRTEAPDLKIIAISGGGRIGPDDHLRAAAAMGACEVFKKPFSIHKLTAAVKRILEE
jgi:DNA-binding response OmpR family regulator